MLSELESFKVGFLNRCVEDGISTEEALSRVKEASDCLDSLEKQAENPFSGMANKALQSPLGQGALNLGGNLYNKMPEGIRSGVANQALRMGGLTNQNAGSWQYPGFTPKPGGQVHVDARTMVENGNLTEDRITTQTPGKAGSPWGQVARGAMTGRMPTRTFSQGSPVANQLDVNMDEITGDKLIPSSASHFNKKGNLGALSPLVSGLLSGAGSTAGSMLVSEAIKKLLGSKKPTAQREKQAAGFFGGMASGAKNLGTKALLAGLIAPPVLGGLAGYSHAKLTDVDDDDVDDFKKQELIDEFQRQAEKLRHSQALMAYKDRRKKRSNVYM